MLSRLSRPFRPIDLGAQALAFFQLARLGEDLRREHEYERSGVCAITLARDEHVTLVLVALRKGAVMRDHRSPSAGTLVLLSGRAVFSAGPYREELDPGCLAAFSADLTHGVEALEDAAYLVIIGGRPRPSAS
jgi:quercetin dioxygenase-like cupin family protein